VEKDLTNRHLATGLPVHHITVIRAALRQLPGPQPGRRAGRKALVRVDGAGASHELLDWLSQRASVLLMPAEMSSSPIRPTRGHLESPLPGHAPRRVLSSA